MHFVGFKADNAYKSLVVVEFFCEKNFSKKSGPKRVA